MVIAFCGSFGLVGVKVVVMVVSGSSECLGSGNVNVRMSG